MSPSEPNRLIYASPNGDHWYVRHIGNIASGGHVTDFSLATFLASGRNGPEHQEFWRLIGTLVGEDRSRHGHIEVA